KIQRVVPEWAVWGFGDRERHHADLTVALDELELAERPDEVIEVVGANLSGARCEVGRSHEGSKAGQPGAQECLTQEFPALQGIVHILERTPERGNGHASLDTELRIWIRYQGLDDDEHSAVPNGFVVGEDKALLPAMSPIFRSEIEPIDDSNGEPAVQVVELLRLESIAFDGIAVQCGRAVGVLVSAVNGAFQATGR